MHRQQIGNIPSGSLNRRTILAGPAALLMMSAVDSSAALAQRTLDGDIAVEAMLRSVAALRNPQASHAFSDISFSATEARCEILRRKLGEITQIERMALSDSAAETLAVLKWDLQTSTREADFYWLGFPLSPYTSVLGAAQETCRTYTFSNSADLAGYVALLMDLPRLLLQVQQKLRGQMRRGIATHPEQVTAVVAAIQGLHDSASQRFNVAPARLTSVPEGRRSAFEAEVARVISTSTRPALARLVQFMRTEYRPDPNPRVGVARYPNGTDYYRHLINYRVGKDLDPHEMHRAALVDLANSEQQLAGLRRDLGFRGSREEFHLDLLTNPRWIASDEADIAARFNAAIRKIEPHIDQYFSKRPNAPYRVQPLPAELQDTIVNGIYQRPAPGNPYGTYLFNGSRLSDTSWAWAAPLIYHELVPGHHFQIATQLESRTLPPYRKNLITYGFAEGWGEYARGLAEEMGVYRDDPIGLYTSKLMDARFATTTVADTGIHAMGWTLDQAEACLAGNPMIKPNLRRRLVLAYGIDFPGNSFSYWYGRKAFAQLRLQAAAARGTRFDVRDFHQMVLDGGCLPLPILEDRAKRWAGSA